MSAIDPAALVLDLAGAALPVVLGWIRDALDGDDEALQRLRSILPAERLVQLEAARAERLLERKRAEEAEAP